MWEKLNILFAAGGAFAVPTLRALLAVGHHIPLVVSQPDRPAGRGRKLTPTPVSQAALELNLPLLRTENINTESLPVVDAMVVIAFGQKIAANVVNAPRLGAINLHASLLPKYRGAAPINWAMMAGETVAGNSIIRLAERMDAGAVLAADALAIGPAETAGELHDRLAEAGAPLVIRTLESMALGSAIEIAQDESLATLAPKLSRQSALLDFTQSAERVVHHVHGLYPWPGCRVMIRENGTDVGRATLIRALAHAVDVKAPPGSIGENGHISAGLGTSIELLELQPEGKRPMALPEYRRGNRFGAGMQIVPIE
jgi:methionyl-tRNA formyltransferase